MSENESATPRSFGEILRVFRGLLVVFFTLGGLFLGPGFLVLGIRGWLLASGSEGWPTTAGVVTRAEEGECSDVECRSVHLTLEYEYEVGGRPYRSNVLWFQTNTGPSHIYPIEGRSPSSAGFDGKVRPGEYRVGQAVSVYHHPRHPERAALRPGVSNAIRFLTVSGGAMFLFFLVQVGRALARRKARPSSGASAPGGEPPGGVGAG